MNKNHFIKEGLRFMDEALSCFCAIEGCEKTSALVKLIHGAILVAETMYEEKNK